MDQQQNDNQQNYRYERKFNVLGLSPEYIEKIIKNHPAMFSEIFYKRYINNIYFDDYDFTGFYKNINGNYERIKYRIRWYGNFYGKIENPLLEIKIRRGYIGEKISYNLKPFEIFENVNINNIMTIILNSDLPEQVILYIKSQLPVVANRYARKYFKSADNKFRITLDTNISYYQLNGINLSFKHKLKDYDPVVLELKYDVEDEEYVSEITSLLPFRITRNSKYANAVEKLFLF